MEQTEGMRTQIGLSRDACNSRTKVHARFEHVLPLNAYAESTLQIASLRSSASSWRKIWRWLDAVAGVFQVGVGRFESVFKHANQGQ